MGNAPGKTSSGLQNRAPVAPPCERLGAHDHAHAAVDSSWSDDPHCRRSVCRIHRSRAVRRRPSAGRSVGAAAGSDEDCRRLLQPDEAHGRDRSPRHPAARSRPATPPRAQRDRSRRWEGHTRKEVEQKFAGEYANWEQDPFTFAPQGGETGLSVLARALPVIREIVVAHPNETVAVISHKATLRLLLCSLLGIDALAGHRDAQLRSVAGVSQCRRLQRRRVRARLVLFNDISHYEGLPAQTSSRLSPWWDIDAR